MHGRFFALVVEEGGGPQMTFNRQPSTALAPEKQRVDAAA